MSRITFSGYDPDPMSEQEERRDAEGEILRHGLKLILGNAERILSNPHHFFCQPVSAYLSTAYVVGGPIPLGILVTAWREGDLLDKCQECGGIVHIIGAGGALSMNGWWGYCAECGAPQRGSRENYLADIVAPIHRLWDRYPNQAIVKRGTRAVYIRRGNRVEKVQPDVVVKPRIEGTPLATLIEELRQPGSLPQVPESTQGSVPGVGDGTCPTPLAPPAGSDSAKVPHSRATKPGDLVLAPPSMSDPILLSSDQEHPAGTSQEAEQPLTALPLVPTGLATLDRCLSGGLPSGTVTYVVSHWREDTRALMLAICGRHLMEHPAAVAYAGWEPLEGVLATLAKGRAGNTNPCPLARAAKQDRAAYKAALRALEDDPFCFIPVDHTTHLADLTASVRLVQEAEPLGLVLISDQWALEDAGRYPPEPAVVRTLQELAASLQVPVVVALSPRGEHGTGSNEPFTLPQEEVQGYVRPGNDACMLLGRLPFPDHRVRHLTISIFVESHPVSGRGGLVHYGFDHFTKNLYERDTSNDDPTAAP